METGFLFAIGASITWGLVYAIDERILSNVSPITLLFVNSIITAVIMLPFLFFGGNSLKILLSSGKINLSIILFSVILAALANFFIFSSIKKLDASTASIIELSYPFFVVFFSFILYKSTPNIYFFLGGALIFIGTLVIVKFA